MDARSSSHHVDYVDTAIFHQSQSNLYAVDVASAGRNTLAQCLLSVIKASIIPTLLEESKTSKSHLPNPYEIASFAGLCLVTDASLATLYVRQLLEKGLAISEIFDGLIAPAARNLGFLWDEDLCDFNQVTIGLTRMQHIAISFGQSSIAKALPSSSQPHALLASMPNSQHTLGVLMASELFRNEGWKVAMRVGAMEEQLIDEAKTESFDVIGFSISIESDIEPLRLMIRRIKSCSANPSIKILIGGEIVNQMPDLDRIVGADALASNAKTVRKLANVFGLRWHAC